MATESSPTVKAVFMGSDSIAIPFLEDWLQTGNGGPRLTGIITRPDRPSGRGKRVLPNTIKSWALDHGLEVVQPENPSKELPYIVSHNQWDIAIVMAYGHILSKTLLSGFRKGCFNLHASLLPALRGPSPIETSIAIGLQQTGVTLMEMVARLDAGPIVDQEPCPIESNTTGPSLRSALSKACIPLMRRNLSKLTDHSYQLVEQNESLASYCRMLTKADAHLDFSLPAATLIQRIRAFQGWPGAVFELGGTTYKIGHAELWNAPENPAPSSTHGTLVSNSRSIWLRAADEWISILSIQKPGSKMLATEEFLRGNALPERATLPFPTACSLIDSKPMRTR